MIYRKNTDNIIVYLQYQRYSQYEHLSSIIDNLRTEPKWVFFVDDDDIVCPDRIKIQLETLERTKARASCCYHQHFGDKKFVDRRPDHCTFAGDFQIIKAFFEYFRGLTKNPVIDVYFILLMEAVGPMVIIPRILYYKRWYRKDQRDWYIFSKQNGYIRGLNYEEILAGCKFVVNNTSWDRFRYFLIINCPSHLPVFQKNIDYFLQFTPK